MRACNYGGDLGRDGHLEAIALVARVFGATCDGDLPTEDRRLLKLAAAAVAFYREVRRIGSGAEVELDFREEEILRAVVEHVDRREN